jgi:hypothetical protein
MEFSTGADYIFIPEQPPETENWEDEMCEVLKSVSWIFAVLIPNLKDILHV